MRDVYEENEKNIKVSAVCGGMSLLVATTALAGSREGLYGGKCIWSGGIENGIKE